MDIIIQRSLSAFPAPQNKEARSHGRKHEQGAGISSIVNSNEWHHAKLTERDYANFIEELS